MNFFPVANDFFVPLSCDYRTIEREEVAARQQGRIIAHSVCGFTAAVSPNSGTGGGFANAMFFG